MQDKYRKYALMEVPRYTSYPTAAQFHDGISEEDYRRWLNAIQTNKPVSLYFHLPFCMQLCWYCGCNTTIVNEYDRVADYLALLRQEIEMVSKALPGKPFVSHIHFGGGTPTIVSSPDFIALMEQVRSTFDVLDDAEIAIEIDPRTVTEAMARTLAKVGINRASLGVQDFSTHIQAKINRVQPFHVVENVVNWLRDVGIADINFDLMYGLPSQTKHDVIRTIDLSLSLKPDRIAVFGYAHVPWFKKHQQMIKENELPGVLERFEQAVTASEKLKDEGYIEIGFDHYARPEDSLSLAVTNRTLRRNFQGYTTDNTEVLIGFGASSIGSTPDGFSQNSPDLGKYRTMIKQGKLPIVRGIALTEDDRLRSAAIEKIMTDLTLNTAVLSEDHGFAADYLDSALQQMSTLEADGLLERNGRFITVTEEGRRFLRNIAVCLDNTHKEKQGRHSAAV